MGPVRVSPALVPSTTFASATPLSNTTIAAMAININIVRLLISVISFRSVLPLWALLAGILVALLSMVSLLLSLDLGRSHLSKGTLAGGVLGIALGSALGIAQIRKNQKKRGKITVFSESGGRAACSTPYAGGKVRLRNRGLGPIGPRTAVGRTSAKNDVCELLRTPFGRSSQEASPTRVVYK